MLDIAETSNKLVLMLYPGFLRSKAETFLLKKMLKITGFGVWKQENSSMSLHPAVVKLTSKEFFVLGMFTQADSSDAWC